MLQLPSPVAVFTFLSVMIIIKEGTARYHNILKLAEKGERPIYRPSSWHKEERAIQKKVKGKSWFGKNDTVVFVQSTPSEVLKKGIEKIIALVSK